MFKKSLAAVAVLGAFAGSALAADVTLYGVVDLGLNYKHVSKTGEASTDDFQMASGQNSGSRFGLMGVEDLGNGYKVGFNLENSFTADDGALDNAGRLFHRESVLYVQSPYGELGFGRVGALDAGTARYAQMGTAASPLGLGHVDWIGKGKNILKGMGDRMDNTITYQSPKMAGVTVLAQASLKSDNKKYDKDEKKAYEVSGAEGSADADRYYAVGAVYGAAGLNAGLIYSQTDWGHDVKKVDGVTDANGAKADKKQVVSGFVNYDFGVAKPMIAAQYWDDGDGKASGTKGYGLIVGATAPVCGGTLKAELGWNDFETVAPGKDSNNMLAAVFYQYPLSKRTSLYTAAGWEQDKVKETGKATQKTNASQVMFGMTHNF